MADDFRVKFWKGTLPVNVMAIVEFDLNLDIVPMSSLRQDADIDALLLDDWQTIVVDQGFIWMIAIKTGFVLAWHTS